MTFGSKLAPVPADFSIGKVTKQKIFFFHFYEIFFLNSGDSMDGN
jgi:hypothetical protein